MSQWGGKYRRDPNEVMYSYLTPNSSEGLGGGFDPFIRKRDNAILEVLSRIPEDAYETLEKMVLSDKFEWFVPEYTLDACTSPFFSSFKQEPVEGDEIREYAKVIYLSPRLEEKKLDLMIGIVAHELAHVYLRHNLIGSSMDEYERQEKEADDLIIKWGFTEELEAVDKYRTKSKE